MAPINPKAHDSGRGRHPDIDPETGELRPDAFDDPRRRDFNRMWADESERSAFLYKLGIEQSQLPPDVQRVVAGQTFNPGGDAFDGYQEYRRTIAGQRNLYGDGLKEITGRDVEAMTLEQYNEHFNADGKPRENVVYYASGRDVDVQNWSGMDPGSQREWRNNR